MIINIKKNVIKLKCKNKKTENMFICIKGIISSKVICF